MSTKILFNLLNEVREREYEKSFFFKFKYEIGSQIFQLMWRDKICTQIDTFLNDDDLAESN